jgi:hypothetical protein
MRITTLGLGLAAAIAGFLFVRNVSAATELASALGGDESELRTVVVYDGGQKRVVKTDAKTVGELLGKIDTALAIGDKVAPGEDTAIDSSLYYVNISRATPFAILEWADSRTAKLYGEGGQPFASQLYDVVPGDDEKEQEAPPANNPGGGGADAGGSNKPKANLTALKTQWMTAAGIPEGEWAYVDYIVFRESSWNPNAVNRSSGACGLAQANPCSKVPGNPYNPVDSLKWQYNYVKTRYGGYRQAYEFWLKKHWY